MSHSSSHSDTVPTRPRRPLRELLLTGSAYSLAATAIAQGIALLTSILYARLLGPNNLGILAIFTQIASVAVAFGGLGLGSSVTKFVAETRSLDPMKLEKLVSTVLVVGLVASLSVSILLFYLAGLLAVEYRSADLGLMLRLSSFVIVLNVLSSSGSAILQGFQEIRRLSALGIAIEAMSVPVIFVSLTALGLVGAAVAGVVLTVVSSCLIFGSAWRCLRHEHLKFHFEFHKESFRSLVRFTLPLLGSLLVLRLAALFQTSFLALSLGFVETGMFKVATTLYHVVLLVPSALGVPLLPAMAELYASAPADRAKRSVTTLIRLAVYAGVPVALAVGFVAKPLIAILYGTDYVGASVLVFILSIAGFADIVGIVAFNTALGEGRTGLILSVDLVQTFVIVVGTVVLVNMFGLIGIGFAVLANSIVYGATILTLLARSNRLEWRGVFSALTLAAGALSFAVFAFLWGNVQVNLWLGGVVVATIVFVFWRRLEPHEKSIVKAALRMLGSRMWLR